MQKETISIAGDTPGSAFSLTVLRFSGTDAGAPSAYLQAALHGSEVPGVAALHLLIPQLVKAEAEGRLRGTITVVPYANPIGLGQFQSGSHLGRFAFGSRVNFNRDFPLLAQPDAALLDRRPTLPAEKRLKATLLGLSLGHDMVLDLHCDDEGLSYLYVPAQLWPQMSDLASCLGSAAVLLWEGSTDAAFEEANLHPYLAALPVVARFDRRVVTTVEFRGLADVSPELARQDADGLYRFLVARGTVEDLAAGVVAPWQGIAAPQTFVEMHTAPMAGAILYHVAPGDHVEAGDVIATIVTEPGSEEGTCRVTAPQAGLLLTRRSQRVARLGEDLAKVIGSHRAAGAGSGALED